ncbi:hypothetical protein MMC06_004165 [Schaereria dolodes]|nr:hypothetical protein [Schaereria dolodes]
MDPLSVSTSIAGLLTVAAAITNLLSSTFDMPRFAQGVLHQVAEIAACLHQLQLFLQGVNTASQSRTSLIMVNHVVVTLTGYVITFSILERTLSKLKSNQPRTVVDRFSLLLTTLTCFSIAEIRASSGTLKGLVYQVLENNKAMTQKIANLEMNQGQIASSDSVRTSIKYKKDEISSLSPFEVIEDNDVSQMKDSWRSSLSKLEFEKYLQIPRVYKRTAHRV